MTNDPNNETIQMIAGQLYLNNVKSIFALSKIADTIQPTPSRQPLLVHLFTLEISSPVQRDPKHMADSSPANHLCLLLKR